MTNNNTSEVPNLYPKPSNFNICPRVYRESLLFSPKSSKKAPPSGDLLVIGADKGPSSEIQE